MRLTAILVFLGALAATLAAQAVVISGNAGYNADSPYNRLYNPATVVTFKGRVTGIEVAPPMPGMGNAISLIVKAQNGGIAHVDVGPEWYVANQVAQVKLKDDVQVTGSKVFVDGKSIILAQMIVVKKDVLTLRRPAGRPYWDAVTTEVVQPLDQGRVVEGIVVGMDTFVDGTNGATQRLRIRTDEGDVLVALAPVWFMQRQPLQILNGANLRVQTFFPLVTGNQVSEFAQRVWIGTQTLILRMDNGRPVWIAAGG